MPIAGAIIAAVRLARDGLARKILQRASAKPASDSSIENIQGRRIAPPLIELGHLLSASRAVEAKKETAADLAYLRGRGTSLGGMRPKCTVTDDDGALSIGKFPSIADERAVTKGEVLALTLARKAGINAAAARIVQSEDLPVALIRRFDRRGNGHRVMYSPPRRCWALR